MKCLTPDCTNHSYEGDGASLLIEMNSLGSSHRRWICLPCLKFLTEGSNAGFNSQLAKNAKQKIER